MADVLIKGMDLGDTKHGCPFTADDLCGGCYCVCGADCDGPFDQRTADCPVTVLPEHHGRLIDADSFEDAFIRHYLEEARKGNLVFAAVEIKQRLADMMGDWPTILEAEVKEDG